MHAFKFDIRAAVLWLAAWGATEAALSTPTPAPVTVAVENRTRPTTCAEEDNVSLVLRGARIGRFTIEALQPAYLASIGDDVTAPDFAGCNFDGGAHPTDPAFSFSPRRVVLHDGPRWKIVALTLPSFWRPHEVPVQVGARKDRGFHLIQVFAQGTKGGKPKEAIVLYPADGYWRLKPLPAPRFGDGVYGSSFVMGPVQERGRPAANITSIKIVPQPLSFRLTFDDGSEAQVRVVEISVRRTALQVTMTPATRDSQPFAVLRSMYVAQDNADMSEVAWRDKPHSALRRSPLPEVSTLEAAELRFGRSVPSRHNTSAPDIRFSGFSPGKTR
ncbi:hypothetical protein BH10PSE18_BH10PSE18_04460 [soil metagenome]